VLGEVGDAPDACPPSITVVTETTGKDGSEAITTRRPDGKHIRFDGRP
jgi:hypothetical protein